MRPLYTLNGNANKRWFVLKAMVVPVLIQPHSVGRLLHHHTVNQISVEKECSAVKKIL